MRLRIQWVVIMLLVAVTALGAASLSVRVRHAAVAGIWYPEDPVQLYTAVRQYIDEADTQPRDRLLVAGVVPDAGYPFSGAVTGHFYKLIQTGQYDKVIILTPSHRATFRGCSVPAVHIYRTPLGDIVLDGAAMRRMIWTPLIQTRSVIYRREAYAQGRVAVHEVEHGVEVQLPFLQVQLGEHKLVPVVVGDMKELTGKIDHKGIEVIAKTLRAVMDDRTLLLVSCTFTQYGYEHGYVPFTTNLAENINHLDARAFNHIMDLDYDGFMAYLEETGNYMTGWVPLAILLKTLEPSTRGVLLDYDTSRSTSTDTSRTSSVSYGALAFFDMSKPPAEQRPVRTLFSNPNAVPTAPGEPVPLELESEIEDADSLDDLPLDTEEAQPIEENPAPEPGASE